MPPANNFVNWPCTALYYAGYPNTNINACLIADAIAWAAVLYFGWRMITHHG